MDIVKQDPGSVVKEGNVQVVNGEIQITPPSKETEGSGANNDAYISSEQTVTKL